MEWGKVGCYKGMWVDGRVGMGWWLEGDVSECESCHILVIDKGIKCSVHIQIYKKI